MESHCGHSHGHGKDDKEHQEEIDTKLKELPLNQRVRAVALNHYQQQKKALDEELEKKIQELQREYDIKSLPIYEQQYQLISGQRAPTEEELAKLPTYVKEGENADQFKTTVEPLPNYWSTAMKNCDSFQGVWGPKDQDILKHLKQINLEIAQGTENFTLKFTFEANEFFTNTELSKTFFYKEGEDFPFRTEGTEIAWKEGQNVTKKTVSKKQKNKKTGASRTVKKEVDAESFFNFFKSTEDGANLDEEEKEKLEEQREQDFELGRSIAEELIPYSLEYFLGVQPDEDYEDMDDDDEDLDDEDDEDDDDEDDGDKKKGKGKKANRKKSGDSSKKGDKPAGGKDGDKPECKTQ